MTVRVHSIQIFKQNSLYPGQRYRKMQPKITFGDTTDMKSTAFFAACFSFSAMADHSDPIGACCKFNSWYVNQINKIFPITDGNEINKCHSINNEKTPVTRRILAMQTKEFYEADIFLKRNTSAMTGRRMPTAIAGGPIQSVSTYTLHSGKKRDHIVIRLHG